MTSRHWTVLRPLTRSNPIESIKRRLYGLLFLLALLAGKLRFIGLRPKFGIRNAEFGIKERDKTPAFDTTPKGIDNKGF
jgi:hypothetical protein